MVCMMALLVLFSTAASAATLQQRKTELRHKTATTLQQLYQRQPKAKAAIQNAAGYAVFNNTGMQLALLGGAHGRGRAANNVTRQEAFMRMEEYQVGLGLGVKEYAVIFVFANQEAWKSFVEKGWSFGAEATAAASDGVSGGAFEGAIQVSPGVWVYQMTTKGLSAELALKGTHYYRDHSFDSK